MKKLCKMILSVCLVGTIMFQAINVNAAEYITGFPGTSDMYGTDNPESVDPFLGLPLPANAKHYYYQEMRGDNIGRNDLSFEYDSNGRFVKSELFELKYDDQGRKAWINSGAYFTNRGAIQELKYNELGLLDSYTNTSKSSNKLTSAAQYEYDENTHTCTVTLCRLETSFNEEKYVTRPVALIEYDPAYGWERIIRYSNLDYSDPSKVFTYTDYTYDERGNLIQESYYNGRDGKYTNKETINGKDYNVLYYGVNSKEYVYDEQNRRIQMTVRSTHVTESDQGEIVDKFEGWEVFHYSYDYDEQGRLVKITKVSETPGNEYWMEYLGAPVTLTSSSSPEICIVTYTY